MRKTILMLLMLFAVAGFCQQSVIPVGYPKISTVFGKRLPAGTYVYITDSAKTWQLLKDCSAMLTMRNVFANGATWYMYAFDGYYGFPFSTLYVDTLNAQDIYGAKHFHTDAVFDGAVTVGGTMVTAGIYPASTNIRDLGLSAKRYQTIYGKNLDVSTNATVGKLILLSDTAVTDPLYTIAVKGVHIYVKVSLTGTPEERWKQLDN